MKTLLNMLKSVHLIEASSSTLIDDLLASSSHKCSKVLMQFYGAVIKYEHNTRREPNKGQLEDYLHETCIDCLCDDSLQLEDCFWCKIGSKKYLCISMLAKELRSICASSSPS